MTKRRAAASIKLTDEGGDRMPVLYAAKERVSCGRAKDAPAATLQVITSCARQRGYSRSCNESQQ